MKNDKTRRLKKRKFQIKPCPFCGNERPYGYHNVFVAYLGCNNCEIFFGSVLVIYKRDELPEELKEYAYEVKLSSIEKDGKIIDYSEHNHVQVDTLAAFNHAGILQKWNTRAVDKTRKKKALKFIKCID